MVDRGRGFFETSSPFETYNPDADKPSTFRGIVDHQLDVSNKLIDGIPGNVTKRFIDPQQYDNPRGYPGLEMVHFGDEKAGKNPFKTSTHAISHQTDGAAKLTRTGK